MHSTANQTQIGGDHYKRAGANGGEEHWDRVQRLGLDYFQAQITKYVERCWLKNGIQDLKKAKHFIEKYIELNQGRRGAAQEGARAERQALADYFESQINELKEVIVQQSQALEAALQLQRENDVRSEMERLHSTLYFVFEGVKENQVHWRCRICREYVYTSADGRPEYVHNAQACHRARSPSRTMGQAEGASSSYVDQARDEPLMHHPV